jgi:hypothetical protein
LLNKLGRILAKKTVWREVGCFRVSSPAKQRSRWGWGDEWIPLTEAWAPAAGSLGGEGHGQEALHTESLFSAGEKEACLRVQCRVGGGRLGRLAVRACKSKPGPGPYSELEKLGVGGGEYSWLSPSQQFPGRPSGKKATQFLLPCPAFLQIIEDRNHGNPRSSGN